MKITNVLSILTLACLWPAGTCPADELYQIPDGVETRWISFENLSGARGEGGQSQQGRKGASNREIKAGERVTLADIEGPGVIRRIWMTVRGNTANLRGLVLRFYWDGQTVPSVEAPLQDFFGIPFARQVPFESCFFSNPEGRSFNCFIPMPFKRRARVVIENQIRPGLFSSILTIQSATGCPTIQPISTPVTVGLTRLLQRRIS
ncbi:DUF2961 domain-containing protein, partial [candidate division KSB1 bacterium]